jgi:hypothetical protein
VPSFPTEGKLGQTQLEWWRQSWASPLMISSLINAHPATTGLLVVVLLVCVGFVEKRIFSDTPIMAATSWILAVLIACFVLSGLPASGPMGILFTVVSLVLGIAGVVHYLNGRRGASRG